MKKSFLICMFLLVLIGFGGNAYSQEVSWNSANQVTIEWDVVEAEGVITYEVFLSNVSLDPDKLVPTSLGVTDVNSFLVSFEDEGKYVLGVQALRSVDNVLVSKSDIAWSDDSEFVHDGETFGVMYYLPPATPTGLLIK